MGIRIFLHSINLVFNQLTSAFRISGALYLVSLVLSGIAFGFYLPAMIGNATPTFVWPLVPLSIVTALLYLWIAVGWHRFVLLDELSSTPVPVFRSDRMLAYFGRGLQAGLICVGAGLVLGLINGVLLVASDGSPVAAIIGTLIMLSILLLIAYRLAPMLPGAAIGQPVGVGAAWAATSGASGTIIVLAVVSAIAAIIIDLPVQLFGWLPGGTWLAFIWLSATAWVKLMVGISILTTLYGVYVEKRTIA